ncbi:MAG: helix-turn-helix transcriptional regulator [Microcoleus sp. PH2017_22_RUC_O_B]|uniref:helix-turn-helix transcriptional regulator n=1 Tax=unclassified Microcoleus TaxID=2642155 RepID=UPI001D8E92D2|nr:MULTISPECIES: helix-turn-helix transcriptional regulator [unclassified Microcoleus]MCC3528370.1 helix-turn-helix transcriptional regulator [Microcoleus sp. PH2017_21_RUC_O_A]MCC3540547.1 helix-turn-helix transcriptional regulator [Microcoleus sp. PH2017_22_RUC_O_B]
MPWNLNLEINDPEIYIKQLPTITKHIPYSQEYKIQWRLAQLKNFDLLNVVWEAGSTYTEGYSFPAKIVFTFFDGDHLFKVGSNELLVNDKHLTISQPGVELIRLQHSSKYSAISIYIDEARFLTELSKYLDKPIDRPNLAQVIDRTTLYGRSLYQMVMTLWSLIDTNGHPLVIENLELAVFSTLVQGSSYNTLEPPIIKVSEISIARVREAAEYIRANMKKELTIAQIAIAMNCSSRSLQTAFARHYGVTPSQFLRNARLEAARMELMESNKTITEVAFEYGFYNPGRFTKYFQQHFRKKPSDILRN